MNGNSGAPASGTGSCPTGQAPSGLDASRGDPSRVIARIVEYAEAIAWQAGVGGMETAGSIVSYLAEHPDQIERLMSGELSVLDWPVGWHEQGRLTWHGQNGKIYTPETVRRARLIKQMEKGK